ncbi:MAG: histidine phosphatase family protein [Myxococcota bacterium]
MLGVWNDLSTLPAGVTHRVVLMRHAKPSAKTQGRCYGKLDVGLGAQGRAQARAAAAAFAPGDVTAIVSSPRIRAKDTADALAAVVGGSVVLEPRFAEIDFGAFEGRTYEEIEASHPEAYRAWMRSPTTMQFPGGESYPQMKTRVLAALAELRAAHRGRAVAVVSHGGVGRIILADALGMPDAAIFALEQSYAGVSILDWFEDTPALRMLNWTPHPRRSVITTRS